MGRSAIPVALLLLLHAGCAGWPKESIRHPHIVVDRDGYPLSDQGRPLDDEVFRNTTVGTELLGAVDRHVAAAAAQRQTPRLVIYAHGGLTGHQQGLQDIGRLVAPETGTIRGTDLFPIFINWDSSGDDTVRDDLVHIRHGERDPFVVTGYLTLPFRFVARLLDSLTGGISSLAYVIDNIAETRFEREEVDPGEVAATIITSPTKIVTWPLIAGFGKGAWEMMKRRINRMFTFEVERKVLRKGAGRVLLERLAERLDTPGGWKLEDGRLVPTELVLAGHSMGALIQNRILTEFPRIVFDRIIYLAGAASIEEFRTSVVPYLKRYPETRFYSLSLSLRDEGTEGQPHNKFPVLPDGSLLVWIDQFFEPGLTVDQRRIGRWRNRRYVWIDTAEEALCQRITLIKFPGRPEDPHQHGDLNDADYLPRALRIATPEGRDYCPFCSFERPQPCSPPAG